MHGYPSAAEHFRSDQSLWFKASRWPISNADPCTGVQLPRCLPDASRCAARTTAARRYVQWPGFRSIEPTGAFGTAGDGRGGGGCGCRPDLEAPIAATLSVFWQLKPQRRHLAAVRGRKSCRGLAGVLRAQGGRRTYDPYRKQAPRLPERCLAAPGQLEAHRRTRSRQGCAYVH